MFKKIISQLSLSPATIEQVANYAESVQRKQRLYGAASIVLFITSMLYIFIIISQPSYSSSITANDLLAGGASTTGSIVSAYDENLSGFYDAASLASIRREDLTKLSSGLACQESARSLPYVTGRLPYGSPSEQTYTLTDHSLLYIRTTDRSIDSDTWCGINQNGNIFAIIKADGNILLSALPDNPDYDILQRSLTVDTTTTKPGETITWTATVHNPSDAVYTHDIWFDLGDILEYADSVTASGGGIVSSQDHQILWSDTEVMPGQTITRTVTATTDQLIDETAQQRHNRYAYDCTITAVFGNATETEIACPVAKQTEKILYSLPSVGNSIGLAIFLTLSALSLAAYCSLRVQAKELRIIRAQLNTGGIV